MSGGNAPMGHQSRYTRPSGSVFFRGPGQLSQTGLPRRLDSAPMSEPQDLTDDIRDNAASPQSVSVERVTVTHQCQLLAGRGFVRRRSLEHAAVPQVGPAAGPLGPGFQRRNIENDPARASLAGDDSVEPDGVWAAEDRQGYVGSQPL